MRAAFAAFLATLTRADRDERLCREIVARGICAPTSDLGIAVRATLARVDSLRADRDDMYLKWVKADNVARSHESGRDWNALGAMARQLGDVCAALGLDSPLRVVEAARFLRDENDTLRGIHRDMLRVVSERDEARRELVALRESVRNVARRMAEQISEVSNG